jgi:PKD repeat protein
MESLCQDGVNCETYTLTVTGTPAQWAGKRVQVLLTWTSSTNEYDIYIHKGSNNNPVVTSAAAGPGLTNQVAYINPSTDGVGVFTIHVAYDTVPAPALDHYHGTATAVPETPAPPPPAPQDSGPKIGYENFEAPGVLTPGTSTSSGGVTVEYMGRGAGEPSIGSNWATGVANFQSDLETLFITFDDSCSLTNPKASWVNRRAPTSVFIDSDPIGFTDRGTTTGRVFASELTLLGPNTVKISHSDDDGLTWIVAQSGGLASAVDHQTIGGGIYHTPIPSGVNPLYPNALYYCSQDIAAALCSRSDDGGTTYGPSVPIYNLTACGGLHGHVKVSPKDGTVYVPNRQCGSQSAVVVSQDNGLTWTIRPVQNGSVSDTAATDDPAVGIDDNGRVYFLFANNGTAAGVATSDDFGATWQNIVDVGVPFPLKNIAFPAAVGGSSTGGNTGRAAVAFYGSVTGTGDSNADTFAGVWHLYIAHTFDGGLTWTTTDATPNMPMQRTGILRGGGGPVTRNLLDFFDITIDRDGRVLVGYVNGCSGGDCAQAPINPDGSSGVTGNAYSVTATIARQSSGRRMLASKSTPTTSAPGMPFVTQRRIGPVVHLAWSEADTGNSPITGYQILRGTASGGETLLTTVPGTQTGGTFDDSTATDITKTYYYKVLAVNGTTAPLGASCANNEIAAPYVGEPCGKMIIHTNDPTHPEALGGSAMQPPTPQLLIDYVAVGEPPSRPGVLMFQMKVGDLSTVPPNSRWRMVWDSPASPDEQYYVGMTTDGTSTVTFEYGTLQTASLVVLGVPTEIPAAGPPDPASNFNADGTITIFLAKSAIGNPQPGDLLGAVNGRTFDTGDSPPMTLERSNLLVDHTFVKGNTDNSYPAATYTVVGNVPCGAIPNTRPTADLKANPTSGNAPLSVTFDGTGSFDPDFSDTIASYTFKFGDGSADVTQASPVVQHTYVSAGIYAAQLVVTDSRGAQSTNTAEQVITVTPATTPTPTPTPGGTPTPTPGGTPTPTPAGTATPTPTPSPQPTPANIQLVNISGRVFVQGGDNVGIGGFIITGSGTKRIIARGMGPSVKVNGNPVPGSLQDPVLELHDSNGGVITNDNWRSTQEAEIQQTGLAPADDHEAAIVKRLPAGTYTAVVRSADGSPGVGLVELYDLSTADPGELGNLSVRASVQTDDNVLIDGLILQGGDPKRVLFRALGPSVQVNGAPVPGALQDPTLELHDGNGALLLSNDNWKDAPNAADIQATGLAPGDDKESAILMTLAPGNYTTVVRGVNRTTGIGLAEAYKLDN